MLRKGDEGRAVKELIQTLTVCLNAEAVSLSIEVRVRAAGREWLPKFLRYWLL